MSITYRNGITPDSETTVEYGSYSNAPATIAPGSDKGTYHLAANPHLYEPQRTNNFEFIVTDIDGIVRAGFEGREAKAREIIENAQEVLRFAVTKSSVPHFEQGVIQVKRGNSTLKYAGTPTFTSGSLEINDFIGSYSKDILMAWQSLSYNVATEKVGLASEYKKDCYLIEYSPDMQIVRQWRLHGCWISNLSETGYDHESNSKKTVSATVQYDSAEIEVE